MLYDQITNELILASLILHTNNISTIGKQIGYAPMLITTALFRGVETGKIEWNREKDFIKISPEVEEKALQVTDNLNELRDLLETFVTYCNAEEKDQSVEEMMIWLGNTPELHIRMAIEQSKVLASYKYKDPSDKASEYTFVTLKENKDKKWGAKQFDAATSKARKLADKKAKKNK